MKTQPFTYIIKFKPTNQWYYGVRWARGCSPNDLWTTYFTSSRHIKALIKEHGLEAFHARVSKIFKTKEEATNHERRFLFRVKAASNGAFINKRNNMPEFSAYGLKIIHHALLQIETWHDPRLPLPLGWSYGITESHRQNNSKAQTGKTAWNKNKKLPSTGPCSETRKENISNSRLLTRKLTCQHCGKLSDPGNFKRFHGDLCKYNPNINTEYWNSLSDVAKKNVKHQIESGSFNNFGRTSQASPDSLLQTSTQCDQE